LGMNVIALRRTSSADLGADAILPIEKLRLLLSSSDFVIAAVPLTEETRGMFREEEFRAMNRGGYFINIARGGLVEEKALVKALKRGWIHGAALDVTEVEPPPPDSELYELDNVILTPHTSGGSREAFERSIGIFRENLRRYLAGEPLLNIVDKATCY
jgi:D-2-hydroxyacid dehydrogenase (NADP+)